MSNNRINIMNYCFKNLNNKRDRDIYNELQKGDDKLIDYNNLRGCPKNHGCTGAVCLCDKDEYIGRRDICKLCWEINLKD